MSMHGAEVLGRRDHRGQHDRLLDAVVRRRAPASRRGCARSIISPPRITWNSTFGAVAISSRSNSRSSRSFTMSMCSRPRNPHRNPNPSAVRGLGLVVQRRVGELQLVEGVAEVGVVAAVGGEQTATTPSAWARGSRAAARCAAVLAGERDRVADLRLVDVLEPGDEVADLAGAERGDRRGLGRHRRRSPRPRTRRRSP